MRRLAALLVLSAALLCSRAAQPASQQPLGLDEMIAVADEIVVGTVVESATRWQGSLVVTDTSVAVDEPLKGTPGTRVTITQLGGTAVHPVIGQLVTMTASTFTLLAPGERVVLFVDHRLPALRQLVGAQQGKLTVRTDAAGAARVPVGPKRLAPRPGRGEVTIAAEAMSLDDLRRRIQARLGKAP